MRINEKFRLNKHIALFGTDQGLYVAILDDNEKIISLSVFGEKENNNEISSKNQNIYE